MNQEELKNLPFIKLLQQINSSFTGLLIQRNFLE